MGGSPKQLANSEEEQARRSGTGRLVPMDCLAAQLTPGSDGCCSYPICPANAPFWDLKRQRHIFRPYIRASAKSILPGSDGGRTMRRAGHPEVARQAGVRVTSMNSIGGAAASPVWMQIKTDVTGIPMCVPKSDTATTLGAAILAGGGRALYGSFGSGWNDHSGGNRLQAQRGQ